MTKRRSIGWRGLAAAAGVLLVTGGFAEAAEVTLRVAGNFSGNKKQVDGVERPFFAALGEMDDVEVNYNTMDALGVKAEDSLRLLKSGVFDIMSVQIGMASRDDPFFEGVDLAGVATDMAEQRKVVDAYRDAMDRRLQERFGIKLLTLWPFGPQMVFCKGEVGGAGDLAGKKVRVFTPSMSKLMQGLGATPVTLQFSEVYLALQRGVADCAVTAPTAGNNAKWPEVTDRFVPLSVSGSVQGHFMNLATWNKLSAEQQGAFVERFREMEQAMWDIAVNVNDDAIACNTGQAGCAEHQKYDMTLVEIAPDSRDLVRRITETTILPDWAAKCDAVDPQCSDTWSATVGKATGLSIAE